MARLLIAITLTLSAAASAQGAGNELATTLVEEKCHLCHGKDGESSNAIYPRLAGQNSRYMIKQLRNFREGVRQSDTMNEMAKNLTDEQIEALADYFSAKPSLSHKVRDKALAAVGEYIYQKGNKFSGIPACASCHGREGLGTEQLPRLAGQHKRYVADQLQAFDQRVRNNDNAIMHTIASKLTELEIAGVSLYVSGIKLEQPAATGE